MERNEQTKNMWTICDLTLGIDFDESTQKAIFTKEETAIEATNIFVNKPKLFTNKMKNLHINAGLVGSNNNGVTIAFRGTDADVKNGWIDWVQDFVAVPTQSNEFPGKVHLGFKIGLLTIFDSMKKEVIKQLNSNENKKLYVTGHSKGAALATLAAYLFSQDKEIINILNSNEKIEVIVFASPRTGDETFKSEYEKQAINHTSYQSFLDIVPHLPGTKKELNLLKQINPIISLISNTDKLPLIENTILNELLVLTKNIALDSLYSYEIIGKPIFFYETLNSPFKKFDIPCIDTTSTNNIYIQENNNFLNPEYNYNLMSLSNINQIVMTNINISDLIELVKDLISDIKTNDFTNIEILDKYNDLINNLFFQKIHYFSYKNMFS